VTGLGEPARPLTAVGGAFRDGGTVVKPQQAPFRQEGGTKPKLPWGGGWSKNSQGGGIPLEGVESLEPSPLT